MSTGLQQRLIDALISVQRAMNSPNIFENEKEGTFSALRRGCLDLRKDPALMESDDFTTELIRDAWLFLIELSKAKLRRKHALECIQLMLRSPKWESVLQSDARVREKIPGLSKDMQNALGQTGPSEPVRRASDSRIPPKTNSVVLPVAPIAQATREEVVAPIREKPEPVNDMNPFKQDFNPFKEARGLRQVSNPYARRKWGAEWWNEQHQSLEQESRVWWS